MYSAVTTSRESDIIKKHEGLVRYTAQPFSRRGVSLEDLMQEGYIALLSAARTWRPESGAKLWTYARKFVLGAMFVAVAKENDARDIDTFQSKAERKAARAKPDAVTAQPTIKSDEAADETPIDDMLAGLECTALLIQELENLPAEDQRVLRMWFFEDKGLRAIATELGVSLGLSHELFHSAVHALRTRVEAQL